MTIDLSDFNDEELRKLAVALEALDKKDVKNTEKPQNDDELHAWILNNLGINVTRKATCPEHDAPFDVIADLFFGREDSALVIGSRGSGKTYIASLWIYLSCHFNPHIEAATVGAIEIQAKRAYSYLKDFINKKGDEKIADSLISETKWAHGAKAEILTGSKSCHPANEPILTTKGYKPISELDPQKDQLASFNKPYLTWGNIPGKIVKGETSRYPGVTYHKNIGKYQAQVNSEEGRVHIGFFDTEEEAWEQVVKYHDENPKIVFPFKIDSWDYDGPLYVIKTENSVTKVTPNHELLLKLTKESRDKWVVYLMKKGEYWRIGKTSVSRLSKRANEEDCEGLWALSVHDTEKDCIASEIILQTKYQLPPVCFDNKTVHDAVKDISSVGARRLLAERNMYENLPLIQRKGTSRKLFDNQWIKTIAANIVPFSGLFEVPTTTEKFENLGGREEAVNLVAYVDVEDYSGKVYGIEIEPFHLYVANGQVVSNSVNGPHPQRVHRDEIELMDIDVYEEALPLDEPVLTPTGWVENGNLKVGDLVIGRDGKPTKIIKINDFDDEKEIFEIVFKDGRKVRCTDNHIWQVRRSKSEFGWFLTKTKKLREYLEQRPQAKFYVPHVEPVEFEPQEQVIHPYIMGVLLGDGCFTRGQVEIATNGETKETIEKFIPDTIKIVDYDKDHIGLVGTEKNVNPYRREISALNLKGTNSKTKFIPDKYLFGSVDQRVYLLQGLMDSDGHVKDNGACSFSTVSERLAKDFMQLVFSLGGTARLGTREYGGKNWTKLNIVSFSLPQDIKPFRIERKLNRYKGTGRAIDQSIESIRPVGSSKVRCIVLDDDEQLYVTTDYIVTHNSLMMESSKKTPDGEFIKAQTLVTSTRKTSDGLMQKIIDECEEAKREGRKPPFRIYNICIKDVIEQVPNCREAYPDLPEEEKCQCHLVQNGEWDDGRPRLFSDVCGGILANAQGYKPITDAHTIFLKSSKHKWEAQQENKRPYVEDITFPEFSRERHGIREFELDPANGPIYCSIDFGGCYDEDTEVLTKRGWLKFKDTTPEDEFASLNPETELVEYQKPRSYIEKQHFGHMERYKNKDIDLLVTPNHKMFVAPVSGDPTGKWELIRSDQTPKSSRMSKTSNGLKDSNRYVPDDRFSPEEWAAFMGIWLAEGHTHLGKTPNGNERKTGVIGITHYTEDNLNYIKQILESKGIKTRKSSTGQLLFNDKKIFSMLREFGGACDKYIPAYIKEWDKDLLLLFLDWYDRGDGDGRRIYTCSKQMADDLQEIAMYAGYAANISVRPPKESSIRGRKIRGNHPQYVVSINKTQVKPRIHNKPHEKETKTIVSKEEWAGRKVYCVELPKYHTLYVRRNGKAVWCGNSNPHAVEWIQVLDYEIEVIGYNGQPKRLKEGTRVLFDELYVAEIGNKKLADLIVEKEMMYRRLNQGFKVAGRFADPQAKAARLDFRDHRPPLVCSWPAVTRDREEHVKRMRDILVDNLFVVDVERCEMFCEEIEVWHQRNKKFDHAVDATLYNVSNIYALEVSNDRKSFETPAHMSKNHTYGPTPFGDDSIPVARKSPLRSARSLNKWD